MLDCKQFPVLYSTATYLAYKIAKRYYHDIHYVWCAQEFHSSTQAATSDPLTIANVFLRHIQSGDRHSHAIEDNISGILCGAHSKLKAGIIDNDTFQLICQMVNCADYEAFLPVVYVINSKSIISHYEEVNKEDRARNNSIEIRVHELKRNEFQIIDFRDVLAGVFTAYDERVGV